MTTAIIQVRMDSRRLPGKALIDIEGKPMLWHVINRLRRVKRLEKIIIATTPRKEDEPILHLADEEKIGYFRGDEIDVLDRFYQAAKKFGADVIVRVTVDCPLLDPEVIDRVAGHYMDNRKDLDYVSNVIKPTYPDGLDTECFPFSSLERAWKEARRPSEREHVTYYIWNNPSLFRLANVPYGKDISFLRWTVDEEKDLIFAREIYRRLKGRWETFRMRDVLKIIETEPEIAAINSDITRNEGLLRSIADEKEGKK